MIVRTLAFLAGCVFVIALLIAAAMPRDAAPPNVFAEFHKEPKEVHFSFDGPFGSYDRQQLQRGFRVYEEVCAACHSMKLVAFRSLTGLGFTDPEVKAIAKNWKVKVPSINDKTGEETTRDATPADFIPPAYPNETAARAGNNNALPPDMSLLAKAREHGPHYIYSLVTGYQNPPADLPKDNLPAPGLHYNPYFANLNIAMPPPLVSDGQVTFDDGKAATVDQMAQDVSAFLMWAAEPKLEDRHRTGIAVMIFLIVATVLAYFAYLNVWAGEKH
jgi:ubiquinol-cytochrome c reductase cytochrome c1 subunit